MPMPQHPIHLDGNEFISAVVRYEWMPCMVLIRKFYVFMKYVAISKKEINEDCARELYESTAIGCHEVGGSVCNVAEPCICI